MSQSERLFVRLPPEQKTQLEDFARAHGYKGLSELVREAVDELILREEGPEFKPAE